MKSLFETPFPVLLNTILREERTCTLELRLRQLEKKIVFEEGAPVACTSNLLHETLGKYLVEKGKLTEAQYQSALAESITTGRQMGELLVQKQLVAPFELYKLLQSNLAHKILDGFRWSDGTYRIFSGAEETDSALRMNSAQLILTGTSNLLPFDVVATHLTFPDDQRFAAVHEPPQAVADVKLSGRNARFLQVAARSPHLLRAHGADRARRGAGAAEAVRAGGARTRGSGGERLRTRPGEGDPDERPRQSPCPPWPLPPRVFPSPTTTSPRGTR